MATLPVGRTTWPLPPNRSAWIFFPPTRINDQFKAALRQTAEEKIAKLKAKTR